PLSLLAGILVGRRAYREDMQARLSRRQQEAKLLVRRYIDEVIFQVGKQLKDRLRLVQRTARDHFGSMADELHRSLSEALTSAKAAAGSYTATRDERVIALQEKVARLDSIRQVIPVLPPTPARQALPAAQHTLPAAPSRKDAGTRPAAEIAR
ncbi:MAG: Isoniazid-inducible protein iniA, partial [Microbacterium sp.]